MELFCVKPVVHYFDRFHEFTEAFELKETDVILTETILYEQSIKKEKPPCKIILKDQYDAGEPREEVIDEILKEMGRHEVHRVIGIGGGSVIDIAKLLCVKGALPIKNVIERKVPLVLDKELIILPPPAGREARSPLAES